MGVSMAVAGLTNLTSSFWPELCADMRLRQFVQLHGTGVVAMFR